MISKSIYEIFKISDDKVTAFIYKWYKLFQMIN